MGLVVLPIRPRAREGNLFALTVPQQLIVDELASVVRIQAEEWKWQALSDGMNSTADVRLASAHQCDAFRPSCGNIRQNQGVQKRALGSVSAMCNQIGFHKPGGRLIPVGKGSNGDFVLQQLSRSRCGNGPAVGMAFLVQESIGGSRTDCK